MAIDLIPPIKNMTNFVAWKEPPFACYQVRLNLELVELGVATASLNGVSCAAKAHGAVAEGEERAGPVVYASRLGWQAALLRLLFASGLSLTMTSQASADVSSGVLSPPASAIFANAGRPASVDERSDQSSSSDLDCANVVATPDN